MRRLGLAIAAGALLAVSNANAGSFPVNTLGAGGSDLVDRIAVRVYVHEGHRYCFYFNGWHGPGWYRCGFAFRRGVGWGGIYGWNDWSYGPYERRFGHNRHHDGDRMGETRSRDRDHDRDRMGVDTRSRGNTRVDTRMRSTTGSSVEHGSKVQSTPGNTSRSEQRTGGSAPLSSGGGNGPAPGGESGPKRP
jgi:hypothetical protein